MRTLALVTLLLASGCTSAEQMIRDATGRLPTAASDQTVYTTDQGDDLRFPLGAVAFADRVARFDFGTGTPDASERNARSAIGTPNYIRDYDGSYVALGHAGSITLEFVDNVLVDGPGPDLAVFEISTPEGSFIEISEDGRSFTRVGTIGGGGVTVDIGPRARPGARYRFVRITDDPDDGYSTGPYAGADIDAVGAIPAERR